MLCEQSKEIETIECFACIKHGTIDRAIVVLIVLHNLTAILKWYTAQ